MTKLTAISIYSGGRTYNVFVELNVVDGKTVLPSNTYATILKHLGIRPGQMFSMG